MSSFAYAGIWGIYHFVLEGIAFLLLQQGAGILATRRAAWLALIWGLLTFGMHFWSFWTDNDLLSYALVACWEVATISFYAAVRFLPISMLFRRPAVYHFAAFWAFFRLCSLVGSTLDYYDLEAGSCVYVFSNWVFFGILKPFIVYFTLLKDSQYWQGIGIHRGLKTEPLLRKQSQSQNAVVKSSSALSIGTSAPMSVPAAAGSSQPSSSGFVDGSACSLPTIPEKGGTVASSLPSNAPFRDRLISYDILSPLLGQQLDRGTAQELVAGMDLLRDNVEVINFAFLSLGKNYQILGAGGTARVYRGKYKGAAVAIKMIYCMELTPDIVSNFYEEALVLSRLKHENVVQLLGISILPPSLCLVMELCEGGNLYDFIHQRQARRTSADTDAYGNVRVAPQEQRYDLDWSTRLALAIGCARGVAYLHTRQPPIVHTDVKSLNFLLTTDLKVKICDFEWSRPKLMELGYTIGVQAHSAHHSPVDPSTVPGVGGAASMTVTPQTSLSSSATMVRSYGAMDESKSSATSATPAPAVARPVNPSRSFTDITAPMQLREEDRNHRRRFSRIPDTLNWTAPEVARAGLFTEKSDVYSLGIVLWEIFTGRVPFDDPDFTRAGTGQRAVRSALRKNYHPPIPADMPTPIGALLLSMWAVDVSQRPTATQVASQLAEIHLAMELHP